jgi:hypothetical protein
MSGSIYFEIEKDLKSLPLNKMKKVREFIRTLLRQTKTKSNFKKLFGCIKKDEADLMKKAIEEW